MRGVGDRGDEVVIKLFRERTIVIEAKKLRRRIERGGRSSARVRVCIVVRTVTEIGSAGCGGYCSSTRDDGTFIDGGVLAFNAEVDELKATNKRSVSMA